MEPVEKSRKKQSSLSLAKSLNENQINAKLRQCKHYLGTFSIDELASLKIALFPCFLIINFDDRSGKGIHWIGIRLDTSHVYVCDSLGGLNPSNRLPQNLIDFLHIQAHNKKLIISKQIQSLNSNACGYYATTFILHLNANKNFSSFLSQFSDSNFDCNDVLVKLLFSQYD